MKFDDVFDFKVQIEMIREMTRKLEYIGVFEMVNL